MRSFGNFREGFGGGGFGGGGFGVGGFIPHPVFNFNKLVTELDIENSIPDS